ncbi:MAG: polymerase, sigma 28 subunit, FliA/WhiG subfamily [Firmicutes bacterium]|nr:polymerase, sigma 28 subunit, FliA/WhiG subfamily [Bacillota bacterium]
MLREYIAELNKIRLLDVEEEKGLWRSYKEAGDMESRRLLIEHYQPLVFKVVLQWRTQETVVFDAIQEGTVGLIEAAESYDHKRGVAFSIYAFHRIRGRILNYLTKEGKLNWVYMDSPMPDGMEDMTLGECLVDDTPDIAYQVECNYLVEQIKTAMGRLPAREQVVMAGMYLEDQEPKQLAESLDISLSHIYRLQKQGTRRLRGMLSRLMQDVKKSL